MTLPIFIAFFLAFAVIWGLYCYRSQRYRTVFILSAVLFLLGFSLLHVDLLLPQTNGQKTLRIERLEEDRIRLQSDQGTSEILRLSDFINDLENPNSPWREALENSSKVYLSGDLSGDLPFLKLMPFLASKDTIYLDQAMRFDRQPNQAYYDIKGEVREGNFVEIELGLPVDSFFIMEEKERHWYPSGSFSYEVKQSGPHSLGIHYVSGKDSLQLSIPLIPRLEKPLQISMLLSSPSMDLNYLKNHWTDQGHQLSAQIGLSKGKDLKENYNQSEPIPSVLTKDFIEKQDLFLFDEASWDALGPRERQRIGEALFTKGLGLIYQVYTPGRKTLFKDSYVDIKEIQNQEQVSRSIASRSSSLKDRYEQHKGILAYGKGNIWIKTAEDDYVKGMEEGKDSYALQLKSVMDALNLPERLSSEVTPSWPWAVDTYAEGVLRSDQEIENLYLEKEENRYPLDFTHFQWPYDHYLFGFWPMASGWHWLNGTTSEGNSLKWPVYVHPKGDFEGNRMQLWKAYFKEKWQLSDFKQDDFSSPFPIQDLGMLLIILSLLLAWIRPRLG